jgi:hypothetical protein
MRHRGRPIVDHVSAWRRSGLPVVEYCRQAGISHATYYYWRKRLLQRGALMPRSAAAVPAAAPFLEIASRPTGLNGYALRFHRIGVDLLVGRGFDSGEVTALARVVSTLQERSGGC